MFGSFDLICQKATLVFIFGPNLKTNTLLRPRPKMNNKQARWQGAVLQSINCIRLSYYNVKIRLLYLDKLCWLKQKLVEQLHQRIVMLSLVSTIQIIKFTSWERAAFFKYFARIVEFQNNLYKFTLEHICKYTYFVKKQDSYTIFRLMVRISREHGS